MTPIDGKRVDASPTKTFFVRMLTRDITLDDCILDLIDNSIDGAWESTGANPSEIVSDGALSDFEINITIDSERFRISDNCGGITLDEAVNYAFTFGRKGTEPSSDYTVGVYGIGMKRAVFKLGESIRISSTYEDGGQLAGFLVPIEVEQWAQDNTPWDFDLEDSPAADEAGVSIEVTRLSPETRQKFEDPTFGRILRQTLARDYLLPLMRGVRITVNGEAVSGLPLALQQGGDFTPMRRTYEDDGVAVEILAGMAAAPPEDSEPDSDSENRVYRTSGWYVICNGRAVLAADRSAVTGWGSRWSAWHPQYSGFVGIVLFSAVDATRLPMTTTKRSVDTSSAVYLRALVQMEPAVRAWTSYTNARKSERDRAIQHEQRSRPTSLSNIRPSDAVGLPRLTTRKPRERIANVNYTVRLVRMQALAAALGNVNMPYREVGTRSFDYAFGSLVDEADE